MRKILLLLIALSCLTFTSAYGRECAGILIPETCTVDGQVLSLNGCGLRTKFFLKIYAGALYTPAKITQASSLYRSDQPKVIRMRFIYRRVSAGRMRDAFAEKFGVDLTDRPTMITVRGRCQGKDGRIHTDSVTKILTVLIYMNAAWEAPGGRLRVLRSPTDLEDYAARKGVPLAEAERWLRPNLGYEPEAEARPAAIASPTA